MNICILLNSKFVDLALVFLNSLFINNKKNKFDIYLLYSDLNNNEIAKLDNFINNHDSKLIKLKINKKIFDNFINNSDYPNEVYYKLLMAKLVPNDVKRLLFCDVDIIVNKSISDLYNTDFKGATLAAVSDYFVNKYDKKHLANLDLNEHNYFNVGIMLINLEKFRKFDFLDKSVDILNKYGKFIKYPEQDILNIIFKDKVLYLDEKYNYISKIRGFSDGFNYIINKNNILESLCIIHYAGIKPFNELYDGKYYEIFWKYVKKSNSNYNYELINGKRKHKFLIILLMRIYRCIFHIKRK